MIVVGMLMLMVLVAGGSNIIWLNKYEALQGRYRELERENRDLDRMLDAKKEVEPVCLCEHGINYHENGRCVQTVKWTVTKGSNLSGVFDKEARCKCKKYVGPEPLPSFYHPLELS